MMSSFQGWGLDGRMDRQERRCEGSENSPYDTIVMVLFSSFLPNILHTGKEFPSCFCSKYLENGDQVIFCL